VTCTEFRAGPGRSAPAFVACAPSRPAPFLPLDRLWESLRFVVCARPSCGLVFFLCRHCDQGRRYCGAHCARAARRASLDGARRRYQASLRGRRCHADRQRRYRERLREAASDASASHEPAARRGVCVSPSAVGVMETPHERPVRAWSSALPVVCARCGRLGRFLRHGALACTGRPEHQRPFRFRTQGP
jgi:hypothetical protein